MTGRERHPGDRLAALVDGRLGEPDRSRVVEHLTRCRECLTEYDAQLALKGMLRDLDRPQAPDALRDRLAEVLAEQRAATRPSRPAGGGPGRGRGVHHWSGTRLARASAAALTVSFLAVGGAYLLGGGTDGNPVVPPVDQYVREHAAVSVGVPLTAPVLYQLVMAPSPMLLTPAGLASSAPALTPTAVPAGLVHP